MDLIERQAAIDAVSNWLYDRDDGRSVDQLLSTLPFVQLEPKPDKNGSEPFGNAEMLGDRTTDDCISRQAAIDALNEQIECCNKALGSFDISPKDEYAVKVERASLEVYKEQLENLPSAQPEIIRCKDCKYWKHDHTCSEHALVSPMCANEFCSRAERRTDE